MALPTVAAPVRGGIVRPAIVYAVQFGAIGAFVPYISIYLGAAGLDLGTVGALIALHAAVSVIAAPSWGALADGVGDVRGPLLAAGALSGLGAALLALAVGPLGLALGIAVLAAASAGMVPMIDSRAVRMAGHRDRFGRARAWGSAAFIVVAFATGAALGRFGPVGLFVLYGPLLVVTGLAAWVLLRLPNDEAAAGPGGRRARGQRFGRVAGMALAALSPTTILSVVRRPGIGPFFVASVVIWSSHAALQSFVSLRLLDLGADATVVAATWSIGALVEVPLMFVFPSLARRFGPERLVAVGGIAFGLRAAISALAVAPEPIVIGSVFGGVGFAFVYIGTVSWVAGAVPREVQATAQGIFTGTATSVGAIAGSIVGGAIGGAVGLPILFGLAAAGYAAGGVIVWATIGRASTRPAGPGDTRTVGQSG